MWSRVALTIALVTIVVLAFLLGRSTGRDAREATFPTFTETVGITSGEGGRLAAFLDEHRGNVVHLDSYLDLSVSMDHQSALEDRFQILEFLEDTRRSLPLSPDGGVWLEFEFGDDRIPPTSHGGTGIVMVPILGYFRVSQTAGSGPSITYHLREIPQVFTIGP